jgi:hypothetical protein
MNFSLKFCAVLVQMKPVCPATVVGTFCVSSEVSRQADPSVEKKQKHDVTERFS